jgi:GH35 family endo-1,4-beta-xylanase
MNRRDFLKTTSASVLAIPLRSITAQERDIGEKKSRDELLDQADTRIEKRRKGDAVLSLIGPDGKPLDAGLAIEIRQRRHKFLFGCNIFKLGKCRTPDDNAAYEKHFAALLNYATLPFYWWSYERQLGKPEDDRTEEIVRWCKANNVTTKGHPLAWNWVEPEWLPAEPEAAMQAQFNRIEHCVRRFKGDINIWDVVNEATHYDRPECKQRAPKLTEAIRRMGVGAYVCGAFKAARKGNPQATLIINDYRTDPAFIDTVISKLVGEDGQGEALDGTKPAFGGPLYDVIGIQSHMHGGYWGAEQTWQVCERFAKFGKPLHFTETTLVSGPRTQQSWLTTPEGEERQAKEVTEFYRVLFSHPAVAAITWWDFTDQGAWQGAPAGFVRADMTPKPAYEQLQRLVKDKWWTQIKTNVAEAGKANFNGFFGQYEVTARISGRRLVGTFWFDESTKETVNVQMS